MLCLLLCCYSAVASACDWFSQAPCVRCGAVWLVSQLLQPVTLKSSQQEEDEADGTIVASELEYSKITVSCETLY
jgi:hypothetical protein